MHRIAMLETANWHVAFGASDIMGSGCDFMV